MAKTKCFTTLYWSFISASKSFVIWLVWTLQRHQSSVESSKEVRCDLWSSPGGWRYLQEPGQHSQNTRGWTEILTFPNNLPPSTFIHSPAVITPNWHSNWLPNTCRLKLPGSNTCLLGVVQPSASSVELSTNLREVSQNFSLFKVPSSAFTTKNLSRHY